MGGLQIKTTKKDDEFKMQKELEYLAKEMNLDDNEKKKLLNLSQKLKVPPTRVAATIFLNNATPNRLNWLRTMALDKNLGPEEQLRFSNIYAIMIEISKPVNYQIGYREIKEEYLSLVNKIRDPENISLFRNYSKDLMIY